MSQKMKWSAQLFVVSLCALALKVFYSNASPDQLRWILAPTTWLVEILSGRTFAFESHAGYMSSDHSFLIAASCAGVNFLITAFLMLTMRTLFTNRLENVSWRFIPVATLGAYLTTIGANTVRICLALDLPRVGPVDGSQLHRLEGIVVYFGFLLGLFLVTEQRATESVWRRLRFPLAIYYVVTLVVPLVNGGYRRGPSFWQHSGFVLVVPLIVSLLMVMFHRWSISARNKPSFDRVRGSIKRHCGKNQKTCIRTLNLRSRCKRKAWGVSPRTTRRYC